GEVFISCWSGRLLPSSVVELLAGEEHLLLISSSLLLGEKKQKTAEEVGSIRSESETDREKDAERSEREAALLVRI
ncbi:MAG: hypothetical protein GY820_18725, partial [Gammaproteobacteria bacterium]|nr:hypothetical protein [Gammaproteobacteria bacterium]